MNKEVSSYISRAPEDQKKIMETIRDIIHKEVPSVIEEFKWSRPIFKANKDFAYLQSNKNHVNLGFYNGVEKLDDPSNLLEGTGKTMRHIKIKKLDNIQQGIIKKWILQIIE